MANIQTFTHNGRSFAYTRDIVLSIPSAVTTQMIATLNSWSDAYPREGTFPEIHWNAASIIARFDGVLSEDKTHFLSYEIESCPAGIAYGALVSDIFKKNLDYFRREVWPQFALLLGPQRHNLNLQDDHLWLPEVSLAAASEGDSLLLIRDNLRRSDPQFREQYGPLTSRSVTPLWHRHNKSYGVKLGWWKEINDAPTHTEDALPWQEAFVIKPMWGKQSHDVFVWGNALRGKSTRTQIMGALHRNRRMFLQRFIEPMKISIGGIAYNLMLRPFFGFNPGLRAWEPIGGMWLARPYPNLRLHWASDAISGPLHIEVTKPTSRTHNIFWRSILS